MKTRFVLAALVSLALTGAAYADTLVNGVWTVRVLIPLDTSLVAVGGSAVTALAAGHRSQGGWLQNPVGATVNLCINEIATASGTTSAGNLTCIVPGQTYVLAPSSNAVSVVSSDSPHPFSGYGWQ
jgi:hypothetical protein